MNKAGISAVIRQNEKGIIYGLTYVDHITKCVFNGSDLGKQYSAKAIPERCRIVVAGQPEKGIHTLEKTPVTGQYTGEFIPADTSLTDALLQEEYTGDILPFDLKKKKKKRKRLSNNQ